MASSSPSWSVRARQFAASPMGWILAAALALRLVAIGWGLPSSDAWDNDGIAPRDFWPGLVETFTPGHYFTYPPAHLALLALLTSPVTAIILFRAPAFTQEAVLGEALKIPYMTAYSLIARGVSVVMSLGIVWAVASMAKEGAGRRAGLFAAAACVCNVTLTYYAHTSNLDVPYLFWATLALLELTRCVSRAEPRRLRRTAVYAALAVSSKDQAYALFLLGVPLALLLAFVLGAWPDEPGRPRLRATLREAVYAALIAAAIVLVVDGALFNPSGFVARLRFLSGPATAPYAYYTGDALGRSLALLDTVRRLDDHYPMAFAPLILIGLARAATLADRRARAAALVPLCAALSYTLFFNCIARRTEERFLMPQMVLWAAYAGIGVDWLWRARGLAGALVRTSCAGVLAWALFRCADVDANLILDPRYDAEAWLEAHVAPGDLLEVHSKSVYLARLPAQARVVRVGPEPPGQRNPLYRAEERQDAFGNIAARSPRWIVESPMAVWPYVAAPPARTEGRVEASTQIAAGRDLDARQFFRALFDESLGYHRVHVSTWTSRFWPRLNVHGSTAPDVWIYER